MAPDDFYWFADWLLTNCTTPAGYRTVISRAYYAAFLKGRAFLLEAGIVFPRTVSKADQHKLVPDLLDWSGDADMEGAAAMLRNLREQRNTADYDMDDSAVETQGEARLRFGDAGTIIGRLNTCRTTRNITGGRFEQVAATVQARAQTLFFGTGT